jgi:hypothetical protein
LVRHNVCQWRSHPPRGMSWETWREMIWPRVFIYFYHLT